MFGHRKYKLLHALMGIVWLTAACGSPSQTESEISTAVAQTVQARDALLTEAVSIPSTTPTTPEINIETTATPAALSTSAPTLVSAPSDPNCINATLVS